MTTVFSFSFWNPRNTTRETRVIPLEGYEALLKISFQPLRRLKVTEVTRVLRTEIEDIVDYLSTLTLLTNQVYIIGKSRLATQLLSGPLVPQFTLRGDS